MPNIHRENLVRILRMAYSGEQAAALAYRGHWKSLKNPGEIRAVRKIEREEWDHRARVGAMLRRLKSGPSAFQERKTWAIGTTIGLSCHVIGWFMPMYFAGRLERANTKEYAVAAFHAEKLGLKNYLGDLRRMSVTEKEHEAFFKSMVRGHWMLPFFRTLFRWG